MKYLLFAGQNYYPSGGFGDYVGIFDSINEAKKSVRTNSDDWAQIVETENYTIVLEGWDISKVLLKREWKWKE